LARFLQRLDHAAVPDEGGDQMKRYRFEIVQRAFGRFGWIVVDERRGGRRVLARSERSYRTKQKALRAINALGGAPVVDTTNGRSRFQLPARSFQLLPDVLPLIVEDARRGGRRSGGRRRRRGAAIGRAS
jgi:hypothetical protein